jgi:3-oxoacyl-[acyl-carrier protein] reductase
MPLDFSGKRVVVAGGSRGIGRSIALGFAGAGADVSICAREAQALAATGEEIERRGVKAHAVTCDLSDAEQIARYIPDAAEFLGGIDILVNNASGFGSTDDEAGWAVSMSVDVMATVRASHAAVPFIARSGGGSIVNISSISGFRPSLRTAPYAAVKAAVIQYTSTQALALAPKNIRVNCVAPGSIEFPGGSWEKRKTENPRLYERILGSIPFGRLGTPEEVADVVMFLASPMARWVTGQTLIVDGGQILSG